MENTFEELIEATFISLSKCTDNKKRTTEIIVSMRKEAEKEHGLGDESLESLMYHVSESKLELAFAYCFLASKINMKHRKNGCPYNLLPYRDLEEMYALAARIKQNVLKATAQNNEKPKDEEQAMKKDNGRIDLLSLVDKRKMPIDDFEKYMESIRNKTPRELGKEMGSLEYDGKIKMLSRGLCKCVCEYLGLNYSKREHRYFNGGRKDRYDILSKGGQR